MPPAASDDGRKGYKGFYGLLFLFFLISSVYLTEDERFPGNNKKFRYSNFLQINNSIVLSLEKSPCYFSWAGVLNWGIWNLCSDSLSAHLFLFGDKWIELPFLLQFFSMLQKHRWNCRRGLCLNQ
jgi:hypothetical protein